MTKTLKTKKGTELALINLKGKEYLPVFGRIILLSEDNEYYTVETEFPVLTDEQTVARATVTIYNDKGSIVRKAQATKRETKKDFSDHTEKAETGAIGRALSTLGMGTAQSVADLDEGGRIVDTPVPYTKVSSSTAKVAEAVIEVAKEFTKPTATKLVVPSPFKAKPKAAVTNAVRSADDGI